MTRSGLSSMRRLADWTLAELRRRFDRPHLLPPDPLVELTVYIGEFPDLPGQYSYKVAEDPPDLKPGLTPEARAKALMTAAAVELGQAGLIPLGLQQPDPAPRDNRKASIAKQPVGHPYQRSKKR